MKNITFKKLSVKNFLSIGEKPIEIEFKPGLNLITGVNLDVPGTKNGVGKSSIIQAFNFAVFGETLQKLTKEQIVNNVTNGKTEVSLEFICDSPKGKNLFKVTRTANPSSLTVLKDGNNKTRDSIPNTTKYILDVLSANIDIFKNCIIMRANNNIPFLSQGRVDKKKFIEGIFNLDVIIKMVKYVKDDLNGNKRDLDINAKLLAKEEDNLADYAERRRKSEENSPSKVEINDKIAKLEEKITELEAVKSDIPDETPVKEELAKVKDEYSRLLDMKNKLTGLFAAAAQRLSNDNKEISKLTESKDLCPLCNRPYDEEHRDHIAGIIGELEKSVEKTNKELDKLSSLKEKSAKKEAELKNKMRELEQFLYSIQEKRAAALRNKDTIQSYRDNILTLRNSLGVDNSAAIKLIDDLIKSSNDKIKVQKDVIVGINDKIAKLDIASFILSEDGIRAFIIKKLLDLLNFRVKYYLAKLNSQYSLEFDQYFDETIKNKNGIPVGYHNLSGAESKMLDLACIWSFRDLLRLQGSVEYNVSFYDEILDSSMDALNSECVCSILASVAKESNQAIYIVSHKADISKNITGETILLEKQNGVTSVVEH